MNNHKLRRICNELAKIAYELEYGMNGTSGYQRSIQRKSDKQLKRELHNHIDELKHKDPGIVNKTQAWIFFITRELRNRGAMFKMPKFNWLVLWLHMEDTLGLGKLIDKIPQLSQLYLTAFGNLETAMKPMDRSGHHVTVYDHQTKSEFTGQLLTNPKRSRLHYGAWTAELDAKSGRFKGETFTGFWDDGGWNLSAH